MRRTLLVAASIHRSQNGGARSGAAGAFYVERLATAVVVAGIAEAAFITVGAIVIAAKVQTSVR